MIYVGANDGMLHAFNATTDATDAQQGKEQMAYVPNTIMRNLPNLTSTSYQHEYYVDGSPVARDAYIDGAWHTVLISGLNAGGQGIFALDVTSAPSITDTAGTAAGKVLWEFGDSATGFSDGDADLGYTFGRPNIVRLHNGKWAAVFGNGYNNTADDDGDGGTTNDSTTGDASLFIVDLETGMKIRKISTETGTAEDPTGSSRPNGLGNVTPIDINGDSITDYVYGGDLFGNVWKFDLTDSSAGNWDVAYTSGTTKLPLFTARANQADATTAQPITSRLSVARHPKEYGGFMVYFGTGKYLESGDNERAGQDNQTLYGIWDRAEDTNGDGIKDLYAFDKDDLLQQKILGETTTSSGSFRILSDYNIVYHEQNNLDAIYAPSTAPDASSSTPTSLSTATHLGWYIDLLNTQGGNTDNEGEKMVSDPIVRINNLLVTTLIPSQDACDFGGESWTLEPDLATGGGLDESRYDVNADGAFSLGDYVAVDGTGNYVSIDADGDGAVDSQYDLDGDGVVDPAFDLDGDGIPDTAVAVSGKKIESGIASSPKLLRDEDDDTTSEIYNTSSGILEVFKKSEELFEGRQSWIELFR
jgi:type IV pilus assembly protein PilY1